MEQDKDKTRAKTGGGYVWDPEKLAWVEKETSQEEAAAEPVTAEQVEEAAVDETEVEGADMEALLETEGIEYKGVLIRLVGAVIDLIILTILGLIIRYTVGYVVHYGMYVVLIYGLLYFVGFWWWRGQTPGLMIIRARVVRTDGARVGVGRAFLRYLFYLILGYGPIIYLVGISFSRNTSAWLTWLLAIIAIIPMALSRQKRGIHDLIAGTCVIDTRSQAAQVEELEEVEGDEAEESETSETDTLKQG